MSEVLNCGADFDWGKLRREKPYPLVIASSKHNQGKSFFLRNKVAYEWRNTERVVVFCKTANEAPTWSQGECAACKGESSVHTCCRKCREASSGGYEDHECIVPQGAVHTTYDSKALEKIYRIQQKEVTLKGKQNAADLLVIFDDCGDLKCKVLNDLALYGRHANISVFILTQYIIQIPKQTRGQADIVFTRGDTNSEIVNVLTKEFFNFIPGGPKKAAAILRKITNDNFQAAVTDSNSLFISRATNRGLFKMGSDDYRRKIFEKSMTMQEYVEKKYCTPKIPEKTKKKTKGSVDVVVRSETGKIVKRYST